MCWHGRTNVVDVHFDIAFKQRSKLLGGYATVAMEDRFLPNKMSKDDFEGVLARYPTVVPEKIRALDQARLHDIPAAVRLRVTARSKKNDQKLAITRQEALTLVDWKLSVPCYLPSSVVLHP